MRGPVNRVRRLAGLPPLPERREGRDQPIPGVVIDLDRTVSGPVVRLAPGVLAVLAGVLAGTGEPWWSIVGIAAVALVAWPHLPLAPLYLGLCALARLGGEDLLAPAEGGGIDGAAVGRLAALVLCLHLLLRTTALASHVPWAGQVELGVVGRAARSVLGTQAVVQVLLALVAWLRGSMPGLAGASGLAAQEWLRMIALVAVVVAGALLVPRVWLRKR